MHSSIISSTSSFLMTSKQQIGYLAFYHPQARCFPADASGKTLPASAEGVKDLGLIPQVRKILLEDGNSPSILT